MWFIAKQPKFTMMFVDSLLSPHMWLLGIFFVPVAVLKLILQYGDICKKCSVKSAVRGLKANIGLTYYKRKGTRQDCSHVDHNQLDPLPVLWICGCTGIP